MIQNDPARPDPVGAIRAMVDRGDFADASEALQGLPETVRFREESYLRFRAYDLPGALRCAEKHFERDRNDVELLRIAGDAAAMERRFDEAQRYYAEARSRLESDPRLTDVAREAESAGLENRAVYVERELKYQKEVAAAEARATTAAVAACGGLVVLFAVVMVVGARRGGGEARGREW
jgi:hypothetical protein